MIRVRTPSRLHFGLLNVSPTAPDKKSSPQAVPLRRFGSLGLMIQAPGIVVSARPSREWSSEGPLAERAMEVARRFGSDIPPHHLRIEQCAPEHAGLGTGTQLALAIGRLLSEMAGEHPEAGEIATRLGRGQRSAIGIHGFAHGGFVVDGGRGPSDAIAPLLARVSFPPDWRIVLVVPMGGHGLHGQDESRAFERLQSEPPDLRRTDELCRLVLLVLLPALHERDFDAFSESLYAFNRVAGEAFVPVQGGIYASRSIEELIEFIRGLGFAGSGQSSWGETVFALAESEDRARALASTLRKRLPTDGREVIVTGADNEGATVDRL
jgi:beta-RFAP synthase